MSNPLFSSQELERVGNAVLTVIGELASPQAGQATLIDERITQAAQMALVSIEWAQRGQPQDAKDSLVGSLTTLCSFLEDSEAMPF